MRKSMIGLCVFALLASVGAARAELTIKEDFTNTALVLKSSASGMNTYELQGQTIRKGGAQSHRPKSRNRGIR